MVGGAESREKLLEGQHCERPPQKLSRQNMHCWHRNAALYTPGHVTTVTQAYFPLSSRRRHSVPELWVGVVPSVVHGHILWSVQGGRSSRSFGWWIILVRLCRRLEEGRGRPVHELHVWSHACQGGLIGPVKIRRWGQEWGKGEGYHRVWPCNFDLVEGIHKRIGMREGWEGEAGQKSHDTRKVVCSGMTLPAPHIPEDIASSIAMGALRSSPGIGNKA